MEDTRTLSFAYNPEQKKEEENGRLHKNSVIFFPYMCIISSKNYGTCSLSTYIAAWSAPYVWANGLRKHAK